MGLALLVMLQIDGCQLQIQKKLHLKLMQQQFNYARTQDTRKSKIETSPNHIPLSNKYISVQTNQNRISVHDTGSPNELDLKQEIRRLKSSIVSLENKVNSNRELITQLQNDLKEQLMKVKENEVLSIEKLKQTLITQIGILERRIMDESKRNKTDINSTSTKIYETRVEMESKFITIDEQMRIVKQSVENRMRKSFDNQWDSESIRNSINILSQQLDNLSQNKLDISSPIIQKLNKSNDTLTYHIDRNGYLMDEENNYLFEDSGNLVKLKEQQLQHLQSFYK